MYLSCDIDGVLIPFPAPDGAIPATHHPDHVVPAGQDAPPAPEAAARTALPARDMRQSPRRGRARGENAQGLQCLRIRRPSSRRASG